MTSADFLVGQTRPKAASGGDFPPQSREFDFWLGEWDVNLRIRQADNTWPDRVKAVARIYSVLNGKAVLELWDSERIKGYSLRYFDPDKQKWVLWLNWPGQNRSGGSGLEGAFRHGRGDFFSTRKRDDGTEVISRYSFNDITPTSLRWDDAYSSDGGKTWTNNWIMEFTRKAQRVALPSSGSDLPTYESGSRCTSDEFRQYEALSGHHQGAVRLANDDGGWKEVEAHLDGYRLLDGCAILSLLRFEDEGDVQESLQLHTWNTHADVFEESRLDARPGSPLEVFYGSKESETMALVRSDRWGDHPGEKRHSWTFGDAEIRLVVAVSEDGSVWKTIAEALFPR